MPFSSSSVLVAGLVNGGAFTRPDDTTAYAAKDVISNSTSSPYVITFAGMGRVTGGIAIAALLIDCAVPVEHRVTAPQLDPIVTAFQHPPCPELEPIPDHMMIHLDGRHDVADTAGEAFLRQYVRVRSCWRGARGNID